MRQGHWKELAWHVGMGLEILAILMLALVALEPVMVALILMSAKTAPFLQLVLSLTAMMPPFYLLAMFGVGVLCVSFSLFLYDGDPGEKKSGIMKICTVVMLCGVLAEALLYANLILLPHIIPIVALGAMFLGALVIHSVSAKLMLGDEGQSNLRIVLILLMLVFFLAAALPISHIVSVTWPLVSILPVLFASVSVINWIACVGCSIYLAPPLSFPSCFSRTRPIPSTEARDQHRDAEIFCQKTAEAQDAEHASVQVKLKDIQGYANSQKRQILLNQREVN